VPAPAQVLVSGGFDDIKSRDIRFLEGASKLGALTVLLWPDAALERLTGNPPRFPLAERSYFLNAVRFVTQVIQADPAGDFNALPEGLRPDVWADYEPVANTSREQSARQHGISYRVFGAEDLKGFPEPPLNPFAPGRKKVIVTGCYDWFHSGHIRFFEEVSLQYLVLKRIPAPGLPRRNSTDLRGF